ncbi:MAG: hypothetical protein DI635_00730 [Pseudoxanthomonas suwonensis]|nr:MAG: hypothetical protein DI635_00730 [Pseudoxanthomonas suwonensis]
MTTTAQAPLIPIQARQIDGDAIQTVNARDLHAFLGVGKVFAAWIQERIAQYSFVEHHDFAVFSDSGKNPCGGRPAKEYALSLSMAKELAMVERNDKGRQARQYFIECERRANATPIDPASLTRMDLIKLAMEAESERLALEHQVAEQAPKVAALERIAEAEGSLCLRDAAKALQVRPIALRNLLLAQRWIYGRPGHSGWLAYQDRIQQGLLTHKVTTLARLDGADKVVEQVRITPKGITRLAQMLQKQVA